MRPPVYQQLADALPAAGFELELDALGPDAFRLYARRRADGQVVARSHWTPRTEDAATSLATNMLMIAEPDVRAVVDKLQL